MRMCIANAPRAYREALAAACQALRPAHQVLLVAPGELDAAVQRLAPELVICSALSSTVDRHRCTWILLYPAGQSLACFRLDSRQVSGPQLDLAPSMALIDETERLLAWLAGGPPQMCPPTRHVVPAPTGVTCAPAAHK